MKCPECNGLGKERTGISFYKNLCSFCYGKKELDWIEYVLGVDVNSRFPCGPKGTLGVAGYDRNK